MNLILTNENLIQDICEQVEIVESGLLIINGTYISIGERYIYPEVDNYSIVYELTIPEYVKPIKYFYINNEFVLNENYIEVEGV